MVEDNETTLVGIPALGQDYAIALKQLYASRNEAVVRARMSRDITLYSHDRKAIMRYERQLKTDLSDLESLDHDIESLEGFLTDSDEFKKVYRQCDKVAYAIDHVGEPIPPSYSSTMNALYQKLQDVASSLLGSRLQTDGDAQRVGRALEKMKKYVPK